MKSQYTLKKVGILLFDEVEVLDFAGPFEVFSKAEVNQQKLFEVFTIGTRKGTLSARGGLKVIPDCIIDEEIFPDVLIVPGGYGAEHLEIKNPKTIEWLKSKKEKVKLITSVCTGAFLLAEAGLLDGRKSTTHHLDYERLEREYPSTQVIRDVRFVDEGEIITSGGISAGIDMSLYIVKRLAGANVAANTARRMEYVIDMEKI